MPCRNGITKQFAKNTCKAEITSNVTKGKAVHEVKYAIFE